MIARDEMSPADRRDWDRMSESEQARAREYIDGDADTALSWLSGLPYRIDPAMCFVLLYRWTETLPDGRTFIQTFLGVREDR